MTWHPEEGQPVPGRGLAILAVVLALALVLVAGATLSVHLDARWGWGLPSRVPAGAAAWLAAYGPPLVAAGAALVALLGLLAVGVTRHAAAGIRPPPPPADDAVERLRRQVEPLATGDLAVWLPEDEGAMGEISRTLNLLVGGVSDLVGAADEASGRLVRVVEEGRAGLETLAVDAQHVRQLADEVLARARHAMSVARLPGGRMRAGEPSPGPQPSSTGPVPAARTPAHGSQPAGLEGIFEVVSELAEQLRVLAVGVSLQAAAADAPVALRTIGDDVQLLADQAGRAVGRLGPLVQAALGEGGGAPEAPPAAASDRIPGGSPAALRIAEQMTALAELAAGLRASAERLARAPEEIAAPLGGLAELANRLRRATGRFRLPD